ncbi:hypothetical protein J5690_02235 [bacterium]|nr:hypothetical protein [bacterium]
MTKEENKTVEAQSILFSRASRILSFCVITPEDRGKPTDCGENKRIREKFESEMKRGGFPMMKVKGIQLENGGSLYLVLNPSFDDAAVYADQFSPMFVFGSRKQLGCDFTIEYYKRNRIGKYYKADSTGTVFAGFFKEKENISEHLERFDKYLNEILVEKESGYDKMLYEQVYGQKKYTGRHILAARHFHLYETKEHRERMEKKNAYMQTEEYKAEQREFNEKLKALREKNRKYEEERRRIAEEKRKNTNKDKSGRKK